MRETANELCRPLCAVVDYTKSDQGRGRTNELRLPLCTVLGYTEWPRENRTTQVHHSQGRTRHSEGSKVKGCVLCVCVVFS